MKRTFLTISKEYLGNSTIQGTETGQAIKRKLNSLCHRTKKKGEVVLLIQDSNKNVFGGFMSHSLEHHTNFFGTGESFLIKFKGDELYCFNSTMNNMFYCFCDEDGFGMGTDPHYGLFVDKELRKGATFSCKTFNNDMLTDKNHFAIYNIEVWGFRD